MSNVSFTQNQEVTKPQTETYNFTYQPKVLIGVASTPHIDLRFATQLRQLSRTPWYLGETYSTAKPIDVARNDCVKKFLIDTPQASHLLFLDTDVLLPPNAVERMLSLNLPVVSGLLVQKMPPYYPLMNVRIAPETYRFCIKWPENQVIQVDAVGCGALLVRRDVYQKFGPPWYSFKGVQSEDYYFTEMAQSVGYSINVDTSIVCAHLGDYMFTIVDFFKYQTDELQRSEAMGVSVKR